MISEKHLEINHILATQIKAEHPDLAEYPEYLTNILRTNASEELHAEVGLSKEMTAYFISELCEHGFFRKHQMIGFAEAPIRVTERGFAAAESPEDFLTQPVDSSGVTIHGDYIDGDKVIKDKVGGSKSVSQNNFNGPMTGINGSSFHDDTQVIDNTFQQISSPNPAELLKLVAALHQTAAQFPQEIQAELMGCIKDVETELRKPEPERNIFRLKKHLFIFVSADRLTATPTAGMKTFKDKAFDLAENLGIELPVP